MGLGGVQGFVAGEVEAGDDVPVPEGGLGDGEAFVRALVAQALQEQSGAHADLLGSGGLGDDPGGLGAPTSASTSAVSRATSSASAVRSSFSRRTCRLTAKSGARTGCGAVLRNEHGEAPDPVAMAVALKPEVCGFEGPGGAGRGRFSKVLAWLRSWAACWSVRATFAQVGQHQSRLGVSAVSRRWHRARSRL